MLIVGVGAIGSVHGRKLLERADRKSSYWLGGERLIELRRHGLILEDAERGGRTVLPVSAVGGATAEDRFRRARQGGPGGDRFARRRAARRCPPQ